MYSILLIVMLAATGGVVLLSFHDILWDQWRAFADHTMNEIAQTSESGSNPFAVSTQPQDALQALLSANSLAYWESPTVFVQIDSSSGYPLNKTSNLGVNTMPPNRAINAKAAQAYREVSIGSRSFLVEDRYLTIGRTAVIVHVAVPLDELNAALAQARRTILFIMLVAIVLVLLLSFALAEQVTEPVNALASAMSEIGSEQLGRRVNLRGRRDEVGQLAQSFNDLLGRLGEAFARERQFISDASHELKTPLTSINANAQMLLRWGNSSPEVLQESLTTIAAESAALADMVNGMLTLAKADRGDAIPKEPVSMALVAQEAARSAQNRATEKGLDLRVEIGAGSPIVEGDPALLRQLVTNLIDNAIKFTNSGYVAVHVRTEPHVAVVEVEDTGPGISDEEIGRIFERFYRADKARSREVSGTGLGLAIVRSIARVHQGAVTAEAAPGGGALFRLTLPRIALTEIS